jgi:hypothetical protein
VFLKVAGEMVVACDQITLVLPGVDNVSILSMPRMIFLAMTFVPMPLILVIMCGAASVPSGYPDTEKGCVVISKHGNRCGNAAKHQQD